MNNLISQDDLNKFINQIVQIAYVIDTSKSMKPNKAQILMLLKELPKHLNNCQACQPEFAIVIYRDFFRTQNNNQNLNNSFLQSDLIQEKSVENNYIYKAFKKDFMSGDSFKNINWNGIEFAAGDDYPEAVLQGLNTCVDYLNWDPNAVKIVIHITDAPPHGMMYRPKYIPNGINYTDNYPQGCPWGATIETVSEKFKNKNIKYTLIECVDEKFDNVLRRMKFIFSSPHNFGEFKNYHVNKPLRVLNTIVDVMETDLKKKLPAFRTYIRNMLQSGEYDL
jgi:hypothetical protein